jgi:hypothetical protein
VKPSTKDEIEGKAHEVKGKVKEKVGQPMSNPDLEEEGQNLSRSCDPAPSGTVHIIFRELSPLGRFSFGLFRLPFYSPIGDMLSVC